MGFEQLPSTPPTRPQTEPTPLSEAKRWTRGDKIIIALATGSVLTIPAIDKTMEVVDRYRLNQHTALREGVLDLGQEMSKRFGTKLQVESENGRYILHIAQHHGSTLDPPEERAKSVQYQRDLEKLIPELKQRYGITVLFHENRTVEAAAFEARKDFQNTFESALRQYQADGHEEYMQYKLWSSLTTIEGQIRSFQPAEKNTPEGWQHDAEAYMALKKNERLLAHILRLPEIKKNQKWSRDCQAAYQKNQALLSLAEATPGFTDRVYLVMGATEKLAREGVIVEKPAETEAARADRPKGKYQTFGQAAEFHERREDVSTHIGTQQGVQAGMQFIPLVYGYGHDFTNNVKNYNAQQANPAYRVGLIRIEYQAWK